MLREFRQHGIRKGWRVWWTWASADDITTLTRETRIRRWVWVRVFRCALNPHYTPLDAQVAADLTKLGPRWALVSSPDLRRYQHDETGRMVDWGPTPTDEPPTS